MALRHMCLGLALFVSSFCAHAGIQHVVDIHGKLLGATGIVLDGTAYNVEFLDGSCAELFGNCDSNNDDQWDFIRIDWRLIWIIADEVLTGDFDTRPSLTNGCDLGPPGDPDYCEINVPVGTGDFERSFCEAGCEVSTLRIINSPQIGYCDDWSGEPDRCDDIWGANSPGRSIFTTHDPHRTWARLSYADNTPVSSPPTVVTLVMVLLALATAVRMRRERQH